jgi:hypothetical protein
MTGPTQQLRLAQLAFYQVGVFSELLQRVVPSNQTMMCLHVSEASVSIHGQEGDSSSNPSSVPSLRRFVSRVYTAKRMQHQLSQGL